MKRYWFLQAKNSGYRHGSKGYINVGKTTQYTEQRHDTAYAVNMGISGLRPEYSDLSTKFVVVDPSNRRGLECKLCFDSDSI